MRTAVAVMMAMMASAGCCATEQGLPAFRVPDCLGVNIHFTSGEEKQVAQLAGAGFKFIRMDFAWSRVETEKGKYDFAQYDGLIDDLARHGVRALFILDYGNVLYDGGKAPFTDEGWAAFARFASAGAAHFRGKGVLWELWNEPNLSKFWQPDASPENYVKLAAMVYPALKEADPNCTVLAPALAGWDFGYLENVFKLGLLEHTDVVSLHPYGSATPEDAERYYATVRSLITKYGPEGREIPYVSGEWGYTAVGGFTIEQQAQYLAREYLANLMNGARLSIWYDWRDDGPDPNEGEHHFGTVYLDFTEKPGYYAAQTLMRELNGYSFACRLSGDSDEDYLALFTNGADYRLAAWTTGQPHVVSIALDTPAAVVSLTGDRSEAEVEGGLLNLNLTGAVQYVEPVTPSKRWALEAAWKVDATTVQEQGEVSARISSTLTALPPGASISAESKGLAGCKSGVVDGSAICSGKYVPSGEGRAKVRVTLHVPGLEQPLVRTVELNTSACPAIDVLPPSGLQLLIAVNRPIVAPDGPYEGRVLIGNTEGLRLAEESKEFAVPKGEDRAIVRLDLLQAPAAVYSFACKLVTREGGEVLRAPAKRYSVLETFADGKAGTEVTKYRTELDGDSKVSAEAKLTYASAPSGGPSNVCAKLTYRFDDGWRFARVSPRPMLKIYEAPKSVKLWIKGDNQDGLARLRFTDSDGQTFQPDYGRINFTDWRCLSADLTGSGAGHWGGKNDGRVRYPISWDTLFLLDNSGGRKREGVVYLGTMMICYD